MDHHHQHGHSHAQPPNMTAQLQKQQDPTDLPADYSPGPYDICCGRGKRNWNHSGNKAFRELIQNRVDQYLEAPTKTAKTAVVVGIVDQIRRMGSHFLKQDKSGRWYDIGDQSAREKVGHSLRDQVSARQKNAAAANEQSDMRSGSGAADTTTRNATIRPGTVADLEHATAAAAMDFAASMVPVPGGLEHQSSTATHLHSNVTTSGGMGMAAAQQQQQQPVQLTAENLNQHQQYQNSRVNRANNAVSSSWLQATSNPAKRPSEVWSDFGGEEEQRRSTLESTTVLENFGRRPSWLAMSFVDTAGASGNPLTASLQSAAMQAAAALQQEMEMNDASDHNHQHDHAPLQHQQQHNPISADNMVDPSANIRSHPITNSLQEAALNAAMAIQQEMGGGGQGYQQQQQQHLNMPPPQAQQHPHQPPLQQQQQQQGLSNVVSGGVITINHNHHQQQHTPPQGMWGGSAGAAAAVADASADLSDEEQRRTSNISLMSATDFGDDMSRMSFSNVFRSSMRKSSMSWASKEMQKIDWHQFCSSSHNGSDQDPDEIEGMNNLTTSASKDEMAHKMEALLKQQEADAEMGDL